MRNRIKSLLLVLPLLAGCSSSFHDLGEPTPMSAPLINERTSRFVTPPSAPAMRYEDRAEMHNTSLWSSDYVQLFRDKRAFREGDILTVRILMNDRAALQNVSGRETDAAAGINGAGTANIFGHTPGEYSVDAGINLNGQIERGGTVNRAEKISLSVAAVVTHASPNGNLVIAGTQEVRVNHELRLLTVEGVVRASDILPDNTIPYEKIAEARISYGGSNTRPRHRWRRPPPNYRAPEISYASPQPAVVEADPRSLTGVQPKS